MRIEISLIAAALLLTACNDEGSTAVPAPIISWKIAYSPNMPASMSGSEGNWYFDFPSQNGVHYVYKLAPAMKVGQTITMRYAITGNANFVPTEGTATARVRLFLQQRGDTLTAQEPYKRWWSLPYVELREGESVGMTRREVHEHLKKGRKARLWRTRHRWGGEVAEIPGGHGDRCVCSVCPYRFGLPEMVICPVRA
jgi:hypothetical protein